MKKILRKYPETILIVLVGIFLVLVLWSFSWGIGVVVREVNRGLNAKGTDSATTNFDLNAAAKIDWRGLVKPQ